MEQTFKNQLDNYCNLLELQAIKEYPNCELNHHKYAYTTGKKYIRIIKCNHKGEYESAFCFVDFTGNLYKCAGWNTPAKGIRGHISNPILDFGGFYR